MYLLLFFLLMAAGVISLRAGTARRRRPLVWLGAGLILADVALFSVLGLWGEGLWFHAIGYGRRFWVFLTAQAAMAGDAEWLRMIDEDAAGAYAQEPSTTTQRFYRRLL